MLYARQNGSDESSRGNYAGVLAPSPVERRSGHAQALLRPRPHAGRVNRLWSSSHGILPVITGGLVSLAFTLTVHFILLNRAKRKLGF